MTLRAVLFDLDDTLHDKSATLAYFGKLQYKAHAFAQRDINPHAWLTKYIDLNNQRIEKQEVFSRLAAMFGLSPSLEHMLLVEFDANLGTHAVPYRGARELLTWCRSVSLKVGIVTNGRDAFQRSKIKGMGFDSLVDCVVTSGGLGVKKPDHFIFLSCLQQLSVNASQAAFVGDDFIADIKPALELGMIAVWRSKLSADSVAFSSESLQEVHHFLCTQIA